MTASVAAGLSGDSGWILTAATLVVAGLLLVPGWIVGRSARLAAPFYFLSLFNYIKKGSW